MKFGTHIRKTIDKLNLPITITDNQSKSNTDQNPTLRDKGPRTQGIGTVAHFYHGRYSGRSMRYPSGQQRQSYTSETYRYMPKKQKL